MNPSVFAGKENVAKLALVTLKFGVSVQPGSGEVHEPGAAFIADFDPPGRGGCDGADERVGKRLLHRMAPPRTVPLHTGGTPGAQFDMAASEPTRTAMY